VHVGDKSFGAGKGKNKKEAEQEAARLAYEAMHAGDKPARPDRPAPTARSNGAARPEAKTQGPSRRA
jgi:hypothetical protein